MPHNLDIEITALRKGWGEWCEDYQRLDDELRAARDCILWLLEEDANGHWEVDEHLPERFRPLLTRARDIIRERYLEANPRADDATVDGEVK